MKDNKLAHALEMQKYIDQNMNNRPNPFDSGIMRAINSSKASVKMDEDQKNRAFTKSLLAFGNGLQGQPKARGLFGNLAVGARAMSPAIGAYHEAEDQAEEENQKRLQYAQSLRAQDEAKAMHFEQQAYARDMADKQMAMHQAQLAEQRQHRHDALEEQKRQHQLMYDAKMSKNVGKDAPYIKDLVKSNVKKLDKLEDQAIKAKVRYDVLNEFDNILDEAERNGLTGTSLMSSVKRGFARKLGFSESVTLDDMLKQAYISRTKELGGSNPSTTEVQLAFATIPGLDKNYTASKIQLKRDRDEARYQIEQFNKVRDLMSQSQFQGMTPTIDMDSKLNQVINNDIERVLFDVKGIPHYNIPEKDYYNARLDGLMTKEEYDMLKVQQQQQKQQQKQQQDDSHMQMMREGMGVH